MFFLVITLIPLITFGWMNMQATRESLEDNTKIEQTNKTSILKSDIQSFTESNLNSLRSITYNVNAQLKAAGRNILSQVGTKSIFLDFIKREEDIQFIATQGMDYSTPPRTITTGSFDLQEETELLKFYENGMKAAKNGKTYLSPVTKAKTIKSHVVLFTIPTIPNDQPTGLVAAVINLDRLNEKIKSTAGENYEIFILSAKGTIVGKANMSYIREDTQLIAHPLVQEFMRLQKGNVMQEFTITKSYSIEMIGGKEEYLGIFAPLSNLNLGLFVQIKSSIAFQVVNSMIQRTVISLFLAAIFAIFAGVSLANSITKPVRELTQASETIAERNFDKRIEIKSRNEIGLLADRFNIMTDEIRNFIRDLQAAADKNKALFISSIRMISAAVDEKDPYTRGHSEKVREYSVEIAQVMGLPGEEIEKIAVSAILHDVGKIGVNDSVLKKAGKLTNEEFEQMKQHPEKGAYILSPIHELSDIIPGILYHHEKWDGTGYPRGLSGENIPLSARVIAVADTFDAMTSDRPYQKAMDVDYVFKLLFDWAGKRYDPQVVASLFQAYERGRIQLSKSRSSFIQ